MRNEAFVSGKLLFNKEYRDGEWGWESVKSNVKI